MSSRNVSNVGVESANLASESAIMLWRLLITMATRVEAWKWIMEMRHQILIREMVMVLDWCTRICNDETTFTVTQISYLGRSTGAHQQCCDIKLSENKMLNSPERDVG